MRSCNALTVGSSPYTSSPTSAASIAARIAGVGRVTVSLRRSTQSMLPLPLEEPCNAQVASSGEESHPVAGTGKFRMGNNEPVERSLLRWNAPHALVERSLLRLEALRVR